MAATHRLYHRASTFLTPFTPRSLGAGLAGSGQAMPLMMERLRKPARADFTDRHPPRYRGVRRNFVQLVAEHSRRFPMSLRFGAPSVQLGRSRDARAAAAPLAKQRLLAPPRQVDVAGELVGLEEPLDRALRALCAEARGLGPARAPALRNHSHFRSHSRATAHSLYTRSAEKFGASVAEVTARTEPQADPVEPRGATPAQAARAVQARLHEHLFAARAGLARAVALRRRSSVPY
jgi:hypothetical protein